MNALMDLYVVGGIALALISIPLYLEKIPPNAFYGFRIGKALQNPEIWYPVNKYGAGWLMGSGILSALTAVGLSFAPGLSLDEYALTCLAVFAGTFMLGLVMTVRYMNSL
jgi:SdpI/YfhL protein family